MPKAQMFTVRQVIYLVINLTEGPNTLMAYGVISTAYHTIAVGFLPQTTAMLELIHARKGHLPDLDRASRRYAAYEHVHDLRSATDALDLLCGLRQGESADDFNTGR